MGFYGDKETIHHFYIFNFMRHAILIIAILMGCGTGCWGQDRHQSIPGLSVKKPIEKRPIRFYMPNGQHLRVDFYDTLANKLITSFDILQNNPYNNFPFEVRRKDAYGYAFYKIPTEEAENRRKYWLSERYLPKYDSLLKPVFLTSNHTVYDGQDRDYAVVGYRMLTFGEVGLPIGFHSTYYVFNSKGEIISTFEHISEGASAYVAVSNDGRYLFVSSDDVQEFPDDEAELGKPMYEIYEVATKKKLFESLIPGAEESVYPKAVFKNMFLFGVNLNEEGKTYSVVDIENKMIYQKHYDYDQYKKLYQVDKEGIFFKGVDGKIFLEKYLDFEKQNLVKK